MSTKCCCQEMLNARSSDRSIIDSPLAVGLDQAYRRHMRKASSLPDGLA